MKNYKTIMLTAVLTGVLAAGLIPPSAQAVTQKSGSVGLQGVIPSPPPSRGATIVNPSNGAVFTSLPITVNGICPTDLLVKIFSNNVFVGSTTCKGGSYSLQVDLFSGQNELVARVYDSLDQAGPDSNKVTVTFRDAQFLQVNSRITLTSIYAQRGAAPGSQLDWPVLLEGGVGPYAISVDWGDGTTPDLISVNAAGTINLKHVYKVAGVYKIVVKATDKNGDKAFLQLVGQATGAIQNDGKSNNSGNLIIKRELLWWPALEMLPFVLVAFWLGGRHALQTQQRQVQDAIAKEKAASKKSLI
jgi:hypothetical protein